MNVALSDVRELKAAADERRVDIHNTGLICACRASNDVVESRLCRISFICSAIHDTVAAQQRLLGRLFEHTSRTAERVVVGHHLKLRFAWLSRKRSVELTEDLWVVGCYPYSAVRISMVQASPLGLTLQGGDSSNPSKSLPPISSVSTGTSFAGLLMTARA